MSELRDEQITKVVSEEETSETVPSLEAGSDKGVWVWIIGAVIVAAVLIFIALYLTKLLPETSNVAVVNGVKITQEDFDIQFSRSEDYLNKMSGGSLTVDQIKKQVIDGMINQTLIITAAEEAGVDVSSEEIDIYIDNIKSKFDSEESFASELEKNDVSMEDLKETIKQQLIIEAYVVSIVGDEVITLTDEEVRAEYDQFVELSPDQQIPAFDMVKDDIAEELKSRKLQIAQTTIIDGLKEGAEIQINL